MNDPSRENSPPRIEEIESALRDPVTRARLAVALAPDASLSGTRATRWQRHRSFLAGLASGAVVVLAFLLPSIQEQWNLYRSGKVIEEYARIGERLLEQRRYTAAEKTFEKAVEMSEGRRLDLVEAQMRAHVQRVNENPEWRGAVPDDISDGDFLYLLEMQADAGRIHDRAATLAAFGSWLASAGRISEAESRLQESLALYPRNLDAHVSLGNILDERGDKRSAEHEYRRAIELDANKPGAQYDLGVLLLEAGRAREAEASLRKYIVLKPDDADGYLRLADALEAQGRGAEAAKLRQSAPAKSSIPRP